MKKISKLFALIGSFAVCTVCAVVGMNSVKVSADTAKIQTHGASVRMVSPTGLRFLSSVSADFAEGYEIGTLVIPKAVLGDNVLNHNDDSADEIDVDYANIVKTQWSNKAVAELDGFDYDETRYYFNAVMTDIPNTDYGTVLVARAYAVKDGVYTYGETVERSIASVSAMALQNGEKGTLLTDYVDYALGENTPAMTKNMYVGQGETALNVTGTNGYAVTWTSSNSDVATVDNDGVLTAKANGTTTITGTLGTNTFTSTVQVGEVPAGEKIVDFTSGSYATQVVCPNTSAGFEYNDSIAVMGEGMVKATAKTFYLDVKVMLPSNLYDYEKVQFYVYNPQSAGRTVRWNGQDIVDVNNGWTLVTLNIHALTGVVCDNFVSFRIYQVEYNTIVNEQFFLSDFYAVKASNETKVVDFTAENYSGKAAANNNGNSSLSFANGLLKCTFSSYSSNCNMGIKFAATDYIGLYDTVTFGVYSHQTEENGNRKLYFGSTAITKIVPGWNIITLDVSTLDSFKDQTMNIADKIGWSGMANYAYSFTDIFGEVKKDVAVDFTASNVASKVTPSGNVTVSYENAMLKSAYSSYSGNCSMSLTLKNTSDISEYTKIKFAIYNAQDKGLGFYFNGTLVQNINYGWNYVTIDVSELTTLDGAVLNIHQTAWNSMANDVYYFTDIVAVK